MGTSHRMDLYFVRHGITDWNKEKRYLGHTDRGILINELDQLTKLKDELQKISFDQIFTSDLCRCQETLTYLNLSLPAYVDTRLREMNFGDWEGKTYEELKHIASYQNWLDNWEHYSTPNGESGESFKARINSFFDELFQQLLENTANYNKQILIMTHGGVIRYFVSKMVSSHTFWEVTVKHGQGIRLSLDWVKGEWVCNSLSEVPFQGKEKS
ncbi:histidine phosphatase family protein [Halalkalibacter alkaliphilus]|uniref:Histidine phosphatase family protein n=1 Tax=Halalkalibacter alkaliphilus TaxID=2917993 RepID=A0A9X2CPT7_9BACI|nr:histidine phosphatase family protein [Halalkalibacter alkaliphilus]MCL7746577.1 histidine phosphatase family protein [Halalkalibacter alkaliphilus]